MPSFDQEAFVRALGAGRIHWSKHCLSRMFGRGIGRDEVLAALRAGDRLVEYADDQPYPSALFLGCSDSGLVHVVGAFDQAEGIVYVVTAYRPDPERFDNGRERRRR